MVAIFFGSKSDVAKMSGAIQCLKTFNLTYSIHILSAHRVPEELVRVVKHEEDLGKEVFIAGAGLSAHLPGVIAAHTIRPVIGVPIDAKMNGTDALFSIVQMPKPIPVACVGIDNSFNAAMLAVQILALKHEHIRHKLIAYRRDMKENFLQENKITVENIENDE